MNALQRFREQGLGAFMSSGSGDYVPPNVEFTSPDILACYRAWHNRMSKEEAEVYFVRYVLKGGKEQKASWLGISTATFYRILARAHEKLP